MIGRLGGARIYAYCEPVDMRKGFEVYSLIESAKLVGTDPEQYLLLATARAIEKPGSALLPHQVAATLG